MTFWIPVMEIDQFGFIEDSCCIPKAQESILRKFPFQRKGGIGGVGGEEESLSSQEPRYCSRSTELTGIVMLSLPETQDGEAEEEYHTPLENSSAVPSSDEAAGAAARAERVVDLARDDEADVSQFRKDEEEDELIVLERKLEKIQALRRKEGSPGSLRSKLRIALGLSDSCVDLDGGNVPDLGSYSDSGVVDCGFDSSRASKGKSVLDECLQDYLTKKLKKAEKKMGIVSGNEHSDASGAGLIEVDHEMQEIRVSNGVYGSGRARRDYLSRRLKYPEKAREDNVGGSSAGESDDRLKRATVDGEFGGILVDRSVKRLKSLKNSGSRDMVKDVAFGNSEAVDLDGGWKESAVKRMKILEVNLQVETPSSFVRIVKEKIRELLKSMEKLNPQEGIAEGSSRRRKSIKNSDRKDTIRIIDLEVSERHDGSVVDRDVENAASCGEPFAGNEGHKNLAQKSIEDIEKFKYTAKSFLPCDKGKRKCPGEGSGMVNGEVNEFEPCDNLVRKISKSREDIGAGHNDVLGKSSNDAQGLRKLPPSIKGQSTDKETRKGYQSRDPPPRPDAPPQDEIVVIAPSTSDAPPPPKVKVPDLLNLMKMITGAHVDTNDGTESFLDVAKRLGMNLPRPRWWPERNFELG